MVRSSRPWALGWTTPRMAGASFALLFSPWSCPLTTPWADGACCITIEPTALSTDHPMPRWSFLLRYDSTHGLVRRSNAWSPFAPSNIQTIALSMNLPAGRRHFLLRYYSIHGLAPPISNWTGCYSSNHGPCTDHLLDSRRFSFVSVPFTILVHRPPTAQTAFLAALLFKPGPSPPTNSWTDAALSPRYIV